MSHYIPHAWSKFGIKNFCHVVTKSFFKERTVIGAQRVPVYGPIIYFGNHSNQFVDAAVFISALPRYPRFLIAEVSMHKPVIGDLARLAGAIPVSRPGDTQFVGLGMIKLSEFKEGENGGFVYKIVAEGTSFKTDNLKPRDTVVIEFEKSKYSFEIEEIQMSNEDSATLISKAQVPKGMMDKYFAYKILPKLDQKLAYEAVTKTMADGGSIGIFPEGGSHDNHNLLPLKAGIAVMALNAASQGIKNIMLVPCGIHYSNPGKVMSSYTVEINKPIVITEELVNHYKKDKRGAVAEIMEMVKTRLEEVVITAGDQEEFECIQLAKSLYPPEGHISQSNEVQTELTHILERCFREFRDTEEIQSVLQSTLTYRDLLMQYQISDENVTKLRLNSQEAMIRFTEALPSFLFSFLIASLTMPLWGPARLFSSQYAENKRNAALKASSVKIRGSDVIASNKLIFLFVLLPIIMTASSVVFGLASGVDSLTSWVATFLIGFFVQPGIYYFGIKEADHLSKKYDEIAALIGVIVYDLTTWRRDQNVLLTARDATVLKLRGTIKALLNQDTPFARKQKDRLNFIFPEEIIDSDSDRISANVDGRPSAHLDSADLMHSLIGFTEEIL